jgi:hypothetical protein
MQNPYEIVHPYRPTISKCMSYTTQIFKTIPNFRYSDQQRRHTSETITTSYKLTKMDTQINKKESLVQTKHTKPKSDYTQERKNLIFRRQKEIDQPSIHFDEQFKLGRKQNKMIASKNSKRNLANHLKFANKSAPAPFVPRQIVIKDRALYDEQSAFTNKPALVIKDDPVSLPKSNRCLKKERKYLSQNNFPMVTVNKAPLVVNNQPKFVAVESRLYHLMMNKLIANQKCYYCDSKGYSYSVDEMTHWATLACRRQDCLGTTKYHLEHGIKSEMGWLAITNPRENQSDEVVIQVEDDVEEQQIKQQEHQVVSQPREEFKSVKKIRNNIKLIRNKPKIPQLMKCTFAEQKTISNIGTRNVSTVPVTQSMSYLQALTNHKPLRDEKIEEELCSPEEIKEALSIYKKLQYKLVKQWQNNLIRPVRTPYYNPFLDKDAYKDRFIRESKNCIYAAITEWFECAKMFGDPIKIHQGWSSNNFKYV